MPQLTLKRVAILVVFLLGALIASRPQAADPDLYWHVRSGEVMIDSGKVITGDVFSHTLTGGPRVHYEWFSEVIMAVSQRIFSYYGLALLAAIYVMAALWLMYRLTTGTLGVRLLLVLLAANASMTASMARPQAWMLIFTLVLVGMVLRRGPGLRWLPVIMFAWANLHGGWVNGYIILAAAVFAETVKLIFGRGGDIVWLRRLILWSLAGALALTLNPYGSDILLVPLDTFKQAALPYINEWLPPDLLNSTHVGFLVLLALGALVLIVQRRNIPLLNAVLLVGFALWGLKTARVVILYSFIAPIILSPYLSDMVRQYVPRFYLSDSRLARPVRLGFPVVLGLSIAVVALFLFGSSPTRIVEIQKQAGYPVDAVAFLQTTDTAPREIFNPYNWGGYLIYSLREYPVFIDGRGDLYQDFFLVYQKIVSLKAGWQDELTALNVNTILTNSDSRLAQALLTETGWRLIYSDSLSVVYIRT